MTDTTLATTGQPLVCYRQAIVGQPPSVGVDSQQRTVTALVAGRQLVGQDGLRIIEWELDWFSKNPVVLFAHDYSQIPIATGIARQTPQGLLGISQFPPPGRYHRSDEVFEAFEDGRLRSFSVGFEVLEPLPDHGVGAVRARLREWSCVAVPADPTATLTTPVGRISEHGFRHPSTEAYPPWLPQLALAVAQLRLTLAGSYSKPKENYAS